MTLERSGASTSNPAKVITPRRIQVAERRAAALELRRARCTYQQIADKVGDGNAGTAHRDVRLAFRSITQDVGREYVDEQLDLLRAVQQLIAPDAFAGDLRAITLFLRMLDQRAKLLGLYAATGIELPTSAIDDRERERSAMHGSAKSDVSSAGDPDRLRVQTTTWTGPLHRHA